LMLVRTRYMDECMQRALEAGATQVVILGAGFDTRAYRFAEQLKNKKIFEVDYQSTQEIKKRRLIEVFGAMPAHVRFTEIDFKKDAQRHELIAAGDQHGEKTFPIGEGVSMYLAESAVRKTRRAL